jgi:hypothetical protein
MPIVNRQAKAFTRANKIFHLTCQLPGLGCIIEFAFRGSEMQIRADNDNAQVAAGPRYGLSPRALFAPVVLLAMSSAALLFWLESKGLSDTVGARIDLGLILIGLPTVLMRAVIRLFAAGVQPMVHGLLLHQGFPRRKHVSIPWPKIRRIYVRRGFAGRIFKSGTLICELVDGRRFSVQDLDAAETAKAEIDEILKERNSGDARSHRNTATINPWRRAEKLL